MGNNVTTVILIFVALYAVVFSSGYFSDFLSLLLSNFITMCLVIFFIFLVLRVCWALEFIKLRNFSAITSAVTSIQCIFQLRHCSFNFWRFDFELFTSSMSLLIIFNHFSSFLTIRNMTIITFNFSVHQLICVVSGSVSTYCFFCLLWVTFFCFFIFLVIFEWMWRYWIFSCWFLENWYSYILELSYGMQLFVKFDAFCHTVPKQ